MTEKIAALLLFYTPWHNLSNLLSFLFVVAVGFIILFINEKVVFLLSQVFCLLLRERFAR